MARQTAPEALIALGFRGLPFHDPFHGPAGRPPLVTAGSLNTADHTDLPFTRSTASCSIRASCTDGTGHRIDSTRCAGISGATFHEPFHADGGYCPIALTKRSDRNLVAARRNLTSLVRRGFIAPAIAPATRCRIELYLDQAAPLRGAGSGAPRAGLWPWEAPPARPRRPNLGRR